MKKQLVLFLGIALFLGTFIRKGHAQAAISVQARAEVIEALTATETSYLNFGKFSPEVQGGQVIVSPEGVRSSNGCVILSGGLPQAGIFHITGAPEATFNILLPQEAAVLTHQNSAKTMLVNNWVTSTQSNSSKVLSNGEQYVYLGATLMVGSVLDNPAGMYSGTFVLTFVYN